MATIKFVVKGNSERAQLNIRLTIARNLDIQRKTGLFVPIKFWNFEKKRFLNSEDKNPVVRDAEFKSIVPQCHKLLNHIESKFYDVVNNGENISANWLGDEIELYFGRETQSQILETKAKEEFDLQIHNDNSLLTYIENYIKSREIDDTINKSTREKYKNLKTKIEEFSKSINAEVQISKCDKFFFNDFQNYLENNNRLMTSTAKRTLKNLKTVLRDARINGYQIHPHLDGVNTTIQTRKKAYLSIEELKMIGNKKLDNEILDLTRDWLLIGCNSGQRVSDFMRFNKKMIRAYMDEDKNEYNFIEFTQVKTKQKVSIPIHPIVLKILNKYNGEFPPKFSQSRQSNDTIFNKNLKLLLEEVGIKDLVEGKLFNEKTKRNEIVVCEKYKIASSHICRRSFASNYYGNPKFPTPLIMAITGHKSEKTFLEYIGKNNVDFALQFAKAIYNE